MSIKIKIYNAAEKFASKYLQEAYYWEKDLQFGAKFLLLFQSFVTAVLLGMEMLLHFTNPLNMIYSLPAFFIVFITILISTLMVLLSQWRFKRTTFCNAQEIIDLVNKSKGISIETAEEEFYRQMITDEKASQYWINNNNRKRVKFLHSAVILSIITLVELLLFAILFLFR